MFLSLNNTFRSVLVLYVFNHFIATCVLLCSIAKKKILVILRKAKVRVEFNRALKGRNV